MYVDIHHDNHANSDMQLDVTSYITLKYGITVYPNVFYDIICLIRGLIKTINH